MRLDDPAVLILIYVYYHSKKIMEALLQALRMHKFKATRLRTNIVPPQDRVRTVYGRSVVDTTRRPLLSQTLLEGELYDLILASAPILPEGTQWHVTVNKNLVCHRHRDTGNYGTSWILFLGDFSGGALVFEDGRRIEESGVWHEFDGQLEHWNEPIAGEKYSVVLYRRAKPLRKIGRKK